MQVSAMRVEVERKKAVEGAGGIGHVVEDER
jgi:hypothetical protein